MGRRENKPHILVNNTGETLISVEEATEAIDEALEKGYLFLDWRERAPEFSGPLDTVRLEPRVAELLEYLLTNPGYLTTQQITGSGLFICKYCGYAQATPQDFKHKNKMGKDCPNISPAMQL